MHQLTRFVSKYFFLLAFGVISWPLAAETAGNMASDTTLPTQVSGKSFTIGEGGNVTMTSNHSIRLLPGTTVLPGGRLVVKVTTPRRISGTNKKATVANPEQKISQTSKASIEVVKAYHLYPVPESSSITGSFNDIAGVLPLQLRVSNPDDLLPSKKLTFSSFSDPSLSGSESKNSFCSFSWGENPATIRVLRV